MLNVPPEQLIGNAQINALFNAMTFDTQQECLASTCPVGDVRKACCDPAARVCQVRLLGISEPCESRSGLVNGPDGNDFDNEQVDACDQYCSTFRGVDGGNGNNTGVDQPSSEDTSSASSEQPETGSCCVAGNCFVDIEQDICEDALIMGTFLGTQQCITDPESPVANCLASDQSSSSTSIPTTCGNGTVDEGEQCDEGNGNSDSPNATCRKNCQPARCGDGILDKSPPDGRTAEKCDDGAKNSNDGTASCRTTCQSRNLYYTFGDWVQKLTLYAIDGVPLPNAPLLGPNIELIILGILTFILL